MELLFDQSQMKLDTFSYVSTCDINRMRTNGSDWQKINLPNEHGMPCPKPKSIYFDVLDSTAHCSQIGSIDPEKFGAYVDNLSKRNAFNQSG